MDKVSNEQRAQVIADAANTLRAQQAYIGELEDKLASVQRRDRVEKLAATMHSKGLELDVSATDLADTLEKAAVAGKLETVEQAVDLVGPDMGRKLASINEEVGAGSGAASSALESFIVGDVG
jgi:hypothetical protein